MDFRRFNWHYERYKPTPYTGPSKVGLESALRLWSEDVRPGDPDFMDVAADLALTFGREAVGDALNEAEGLYDEWLDRL